MARYRHPFVSPAVATLLLLLPMPGSAFADTVSRGAMLANSCATCHGPDGAGAGRIPRINDLSKKDLVELMQAFRSGERPSTVMDRHAKGYSDDEVSQIADHFVSLKK